MTHTYAYQGTGTYAKAIAINIAISPKQAREICKSVRGMRLDRAKTYLEQVTKLEQAVAFKRFNRDVGHKTGMAAGRYPVKASRAILSLLQTAEANAQHKGMSVGDLFVNHIVSQKAASSPRYGRRRGITGKRAHVEVVLIEKEVQEKTRKKKAQEGKKEEKKQPSVPEKKTEIKQEEKKEKPAEQKEKIELATVEQPKKEKVEQKPLPQEQSQEKPTEQDKGETKQ